MPFIVSSRMVVAAIMMLGLTACEANRQVNGDYVEADRLQKIVPHVHTRDDVYSILGTPSTSAPFIDDTWYYIGSRSDRIAFFKRDVFDRQIVAIHFDEKGVVSSVEKFGLERGQDVSLVARETPTFGEDLTVVDQLLGNLGRFNKEPDKRPGE